MKHVSFVATVDRVSPQDVDESPELSGAISYWNRDAYPPKEWLSLVENDWGPAGLVMRRGDEVLGFVVFAPLEFLSRAQRISGELSDENTVLLACASGDRRTRKHLLVRMLKELRHRGVTKVEAIADDFGSPWHVSTGFMLENGWKAVRRVRRYTLMRADLGSAVEVGELARDIIGRVRIPQLKSIPPAPGGACVQVELSAHVEPSFGNGSTIVFTADIPSGVVA